MKHEQAQNRRALSTKSRGTRSARVSLQKRAIPVARERNPTRHTHGKRVLPGTRGKRVSRGATPVARERDPTRHAWETRFPDAQPRSRGSATLPATRGKRAFQMRNAGRAGARPYPSRARNAFSRRTPTRRHADTSPPTSVTGSVTYDRYFL
jgi:hypothetical protein